MLQEDNQHPITPSSAQTSKISLNPRRFLSPPPTDGSESPPLTGKQEEYLARIEAIVGEDFDIEGFFRDNKEKLLKIDYFKSMPPETEEQAKILDGLDLESFISGGVQVRATSPTDDQVETLISILEQLMGDSNQTPTDLAG